MMEDVVSVVIPVFNDWESAQTLVSHLSATARGVSYRVILVDDSSTTLAQDNWPGVGQRGIESLRIVRLACNMGHQRAIAVGLVVAKDDIDSCSSVAVMDGDGEDRPEELVSLLSSSAAHPEAVICARRARRSEPFAFRAFYHVYKVLFGRLTGAQIDFGNFCLIPKTALRAIVSQPGIWNHLAATLTRARVPLVKIDTVRGERYAGESKMNFVSLVVHGLSAVAVYADVALVRVIILALVLAACAITGLVVIACIKFLTDLAIPGWASNVAGTLLVLLFQAVITPAVGVFVVLSFRTTRTVVPAVDAKTFIESIRVVSPALRSERHARSA